MILSIIVLLTTQSCVPYKDLQNFNQGPEFAELEGEIQAQAAVRIQPEDILFIQVMSADEEASSPYNMSLGAGGGVGGQANPLFGYLVNQEGYIDYPGLGKIQVAGLTIQEIKDKFEVELEQYLVNPIIKTRILNFRISVIGEVGNPGTIIVNEENINIIEAISRAGDLTDYSRRDNILIIREQDGKREFGYINLFDRAVFNSPYFQLRQNDIVYVEPTKAITATVRDPINEILPIIASSLSFVTVIVSLLTR